MRCGVIDIGSNSVKFLVAEKVGLELRILREDSYSTRLAEDLLATAELKLEAMQRTLELLSQLRAEGDVLQVEKWMAVATSAVRDARNRKDFLKAAAERLRFSVRLLSGDEEAETIYEGVTSDPQMRRRDVLAVDVGGGSAEWVQGRAGLIERRISLPLGCVRLRERFVDQYPLSTSKCQQMLTALEEQLSPVLRSFSAESRTLVGTGGTITAAGAMILQLVQYDPEKVHLLAISYPVLEAKFHELAALTPEQLVKTTGLPAKRSDIIVPGISVFLVTMKLLRAKEILVSTRGLRFGILNQLIG